MRRASPLGLIVLTYLSERPMHAYEVFKVLEQRDAGSVVPFSHGAVYSAIRQLEGRGLIRAAGVGRKGNLPRHTVYEVTAEGAVEMQTWLGDLLSRPRREHQSFLAALSLMGALTPAVAVEHLRARLASLDETLRTGQEAYARALDMSVHPLFLLEEELRVAQLSTEREFVLGVIDRINDPEVGWLDTWEAAHEARLRAAHLAQP